MGEINIGVITEEQFVELFATRKQLEKYYSLGKFSGVNKQTVMKQAARVCEIRDLGKRRYEISNVHRYPEPNNIEKLKGGIYQYLIPLVLQNLIDAKIYELENITFTCMKWHRMVEIINDNYMHLRRNIAYWSNKLDLSKDAINDFYKYTDNTLAYYFKKSLEYLKTANLFDYQEINWICVREVIESVDKNGKQSIKVKHLHHKAEHNEMEFIRKCELAACINAGICVDNDIDKYYGAKSRAYLNKLRELLAEQDILYFYKAYEIFSSDKDIQRCYKFLNSYDMNDKNEFTLKLNSMFQQHILTNAKKRILDKPEKRNLHSKSDLKKFMKDYRKIVKLTLSYDSSSADISNLLGSTEEDAINKVISDSIHISYNGKAINVGVLNEPYKRKRQYRNFSNGNIDNQ